MAVSAFKTCLIVVVAFNQINTVLVTVTVADNNNMILSEFTILGHLQDYWTPFHIFYGDVKGPSFIRLDKF